MFEQLKKITRGFVGGLIGLVIGTFITNRSFAYSLLGSCIGTILIAGSISIGFGACAIAVGLGVGGISSAVKCAYASYHLGISKGVENGIEDVLEDGIGLNLSKLKRKIAAQLRAHLQNNLREAFPNENIRSPLLDNKNQLIIDDANRPVVKLTQALSEPFTDYALLSDKEIEAFDKSASPDEKKQLNEYHSFFHHRDERGQKDTVCSLSQESLKNFTNASVITIEKKVEEKKEDQKNNPPKIYSFTFALNEFKDFIQHENDDATNPVDRAKLNDPNISFVLGFPQWISNFVRAVRDKLSLRQSASPTTITINTPSLPAPLAEKAFFDKKPAKVKMIASADPPTSALSPSLKRA